MEEQTQQSERRYTVKPEDFIPFIGSFVYQHRNWKEAEGRTPKPYGQYFLTGVGLTALNIATGLALYHYVVKGLEALIK